MAVTPNGTFIEDRCWLARVRNGPDGKICGVAFAVDERHLMTCAHVVNVAGADGPGRIVFVDFPLLSHAGCSARVLEEGWAPGNGTAGDTAILYLTEPVPALTPAPLRSLRSLDGHTFTCYGVPAGYEDSVPTRGEVGKAAGQEWVKLEVASELLVQPGFSGAAIWSDQAGAVVAMLITRDVVSEGRVAFALPVGVVADCKRRVGDRSERVADALVTALDLDPHRDSHWGPRSRGVAKDSDGWLFSGRRRATGELVAWLTSGGRPGLRVVTGAPGSGKSAIVARLVTTSDRHYRDRIPDLDGNDPTVPPKDAFDVTFHATGRTVIDLVTHMADVTDEEAEDLEALLVAFDKRGRWPVMAIDALDESVEPKAMARALVDLAEQGARVLVGTRDHLVDELSDPEPMRVDQSPFLEAADVDAYVRRLLEAQPASASVSNAEVRELCQAAEGNFLVAQLVARALALGGHRARPFPSQVRQAFERYLDALPYPRSARDLLLPLAYASGDGLPADLWLSAVTALRPGYGRTDLEDLLASPVGSFLVTHLDAAGGHRHRLFHLALAETLAARRDRAMDHDEIWRAWLGTLPTDAEGNPSWREAGPYLCQHGADHAAAVDRLDEIIEQPSYLLVGDLDRVLIQLAGHPVERVAGQRAVLRLTSHRARPLEPSGRAQLLALGAHHLGLPLLARAVVAHGQPRWVPTWAHPLGHANQPLTGHIGSVNSVAVGHVGESQVVVSGGDDATVRLWDAASGQPLGEPLTGHTQSVLSVALGGAGGRPLIVSGGEDGTVRLWDAATGQRLGEPLTGHADTVLSVDVGRLAGRAVIVSGDDDGTVRLWDAATGGLVGRPLTGHTGCVNGVAIGRAGERDVVVSGGEDGTVRLWDAATGGLVGRPLTGHTDWVNGVALGQVDGRDIVVSSGDDGTVRLWNTASGHPIGEPLTGHTGSVNAVALTQVEGRPAIVSSGEDRTVRLWDAAGSDTPGKLLTGHTGWVNALALGEIGGRQVVVSGGDRTVRLWDPVTGEPLGKPLAGHTDWVNAVAIGEIGGRQVVVSGGDRTVRLWDPLSGEPLGKPLTGHTDWVLSLALARVGKRLVVVSGGDDGTVRLWDGASGDVLGGPLTGHAGCVNSVAAGQVGGRLVVLSGSDDDGTVRIWDAASRHLLGEFFTGHPGWVVSLALGQVGGGDVFVSGGDHRVRLWDLVSEYQSGPARLVERPESMYLIEAVKAVAMDHKGTLFVATGRAVCRFDLLHTPPTEG